MQVKKEIELIAAAEFSLKTSLSKGVTCRCDTMLRGWGDISCLELRYSLRVAFS